MSFFSPGPIEVGVILLVVLIVFGPGRLPEVFRALGSGMRQFKEASNPELFATTTATAANSPVTPIAETAATQAVATEAAEPATTTAS